MCGISVAECSACSDISCGDAALGWAMEHTGTTGHTTTTHEPV